MNKMKLIENHPKRIMIETILIVSFISLFAYIYFDNSELLTMKNPISGAVILDRYPEIEWSGNSNDYLLLIDNDIDFKSPLINITQNSSYFKINDQLDFGDYYIKIIDNIHHKYKISKFTVSSYVAVTVDKDGNIINDGNTKIIASDSISTTGGVILDINQMLSNKLINQSLEFAQNE
jgi:hypothetical protein